MYNPVQILYSKLNNNFKLFIMNSKISLFSIQNKNKKGTNNAKDLRNHNDLLRKQNTPIDRAISVHHRRDLDSLG